MPKQFYDRTLFSPHLYSYNTVARTAYIFVAQLNIERNAQLLCFLHIKLDPMQKSCCPWFEWILS